MTCSVKVCIYFIFVLLFFYVLFSVQESNTDEDKKLSASYENLSEGTTSKVLMLCDDQYLNLFSSILLLNIVYICINILSVSGENWRTGRDL